MYCLKAKKYLIPPINATTPPTETKDKLIELISSYYLTKAGISDTKTNLNKQLN